jgi:predicted MPP superfamily phosphohydrolase
MRNRSGWWMIVIVMILLDLYVFQVVKSLTSEASEKTRLVVYSIYWTLSIAAIAAILILPYLDTDSWPKTLRNYIFTFVAGLFIAKLLASIFFLLDDIRRGITWIISKIFPGNDSSVNPANAWNLTRSAFMSWVGVGLGGSFLGLFSYGLTNKYNYQVKRLRLSFNNLPQSFKGLKIVQISDVHSGSFGNKDAVARGIDMILKENADIIFFTGDLVNDRSDEMEDYMDVFGRLKAPMGVYSTLGNHDYGDYVQWESAEAKRQNLDNLKQRHRTLGWRLLMNEHIALEKNNEKIAILGIENWSAKSQFPKYGRMADAYKGSEAYPFKILLSHDPTHWDAEVRTKYTDVDLMLAGHTHGMQFGLETPFFKWSPVQWVYKQWAGLYEEGNQKLYINRGYGFIGYPGRVGILPEITVIELV